MDFMRRFERSVMKMKRLLCALLCMALVLGIGDIRGYAAENLSSYLVQMPELTLLSAQNLDIPMTRVRDGLYLVDSAADVAALQEAGLVEYFEPNAPLALMANQWNMEAIHAQAAWAHQDAEGEFDRRGDAVTVALIDSGVEADNSDFRTEYILPYHDLKGNKNGVDIWHGTFVAGILAAQLDNGIGVDGAVPNVKILPICVTKDGTTDTATVIRAIDYAVKQKVDVINLSVGGGLASPSLERACQDARKAGVILVAAAGNYKNAEEPRSDRNYMYPAGYRCVVSVSGCKMSSDGPVFDDQYSYYNDAIDVSAPGSQIHSLYLGGGVASASGTSFAAPVVSAMAAIAKQCNPRIGMDTFLDLLYATSTDLGETGYDCYYGAGFVNMEAFVGALEEAYPIDYRSGEAQAQFLEDVPRSYTIADPDFLLPEPVRDGYVFQGWYDNPEWRGNPITVLPTASMGARTYYARWAPIPNTAPALSPNAPTEGNATPASLDGGIPAVPFTADVSGWFTDAEHDALTYRLVAGPGALSGEIYTYIPTAADSGKEIAIQLQAVDGKGAQSQVHTLTVHVAELPASQPVLQGDSQLWLNLCKLPEVISLRLCVYDSAIVSVTCNGSDIPWHMEGEALLLLPPDALGEYALTISFDRGEPIDCHWTVGRDCPSKAFGDVPIDAWYHSAVDFAVEQGLMQGVSADRFAPNSVFTRAMLVTVLYRMEGEPAVNDSIPFTDVAEGTWYSDAVAWAYAKGIVNGRTPDCFAPNAPLTREQLVTMLFRYAGDDGVRIGLDRFPDASAVSGYALDAMDWAIGHSIVSGIASGDTTTLSPRASATRAQVAAILMRFLTA